MAKKILSASSKLNIDQNYPFGFIKQMVINPVMSAMTIQDEEAKMQKLKEILQMLEAVNNKLMSQLPIDVLIKML